MVPRAPISLVFSRRFPSAPPFPLFTSFSGSCPWSCTHSSLKGRWEQVVGGAWFKVALEWFAIEKILKTYRLKKKKNQDPFKVSWAEYLSSEAPKISGSIENFSHLFPSGVLWFHGFTHCPFLLSVPNSQKQIAPMNCLFKLIFSKIQMLSLSHHFTPLL